VHFNIFDIIIMEFIIKANQQKSVFDDRTDTVIADFKEKSKGHYNPLLALILKQLESKIQNQKGENE